MAEFSDFELSGDRKALPPTAPVPHEAAPRLEQGEAPPGPRRGRLSSLAAPAVILVAAVAILSVRPPEPTWTASGPSPKSAIESPTTYPLVVRVAPVAAGGAATGVVPTPVVEASPGASGAAQPPLELLSAADTHPPQPKAVANPAVAALAAPVPAQPPALEPKPRPEPVVAAVAPAPPVPAQPPAPALGAKPFTVEVPHDPIQTRLAVASIAAEARRKQEEAAQAAALRNSIQQIEQERMAEQLTSERASADQRRVEFRQELAAILQRDGDRAAPEIWRLVESRHVEPSPTAEQAITEALRARKGRLDRADRVAIFRAQGLDESLIFAELYREQVAMMPARRGPRTKEEAVVRAARALLAIDPGPTSTARAVSRP